MVRSPSVPSVALNFLQCEDCPLGGTVGSGYIPEQWRRKEWNGTLTTLCTLCYHFVGQWPHILIQSNPHLATTMDWLALLHLQWRIPIIETQVPPTPTPHCVTKTGNMAHVNNGTYIISEWCKGRALTEAASEYDSRRELTGSKFSQIYCRNANSCENNRSDPRSGKYDHFISMCNYRDVTSGVFAIQLSDNAQSAA